MTKFINRITKVLFAGRTARRRQASVDRSTASASLEDRKLLTVSSLGFSGNKLIVRSDNNASNVEVRQSGTSLQIRDVGTNRTWSYARSAVGTVEFQGGAGNDRFVNYISNLPIIAFGGAGNDYLEGYNGNDHFIGGAGNDTMVGYGGNDMMWGEAGDDILRGMDGDDQLMGGDGNDQLVGNAGYDRMWGGNGNDVMISIDGGTTDFVQGDAGNDIMWVDRIGSARDGIAGATSTDVIQEVAGFANGADRTLNGDRIADPTLLKSTEAYRTFANNPLFSSSGPSMNDVRQGSVGDCYFLAGIAGIAMDSPNAIRNNIVDFQDGTYGVRYGNSFYRVDNDLAVTSAGSTTLTYAKLGAQNSMWVAIAEKAWAAYRTGANTMASIAGGWSVEVNRAFRAPSTGDRAFSSYSSATALVNEIYTRWNNYGAVTLGFLSSSTTAAENAASNLVMDHMYTVVRFVRNTAGTITGVVLRNPWGVDGRGNDGNNDGLVTVTPAQIFGLVGRVNWGRV
jgi:hypothetical protein